MLRRLQFACLGMLAGSALCAVMVGVGLAIRAGDQAWGSPQGGLYVLGGVIVISQGLWWGLLPPSATK